MREQAARQGERLEGWDSAEGFVPLRKKVGTTEQDQEPSHKCASLILHLEKTSRNWSRLWNDLGP